MQLAGEIHRGNDLTFARLNTKMWKEMDPPFMSVNITVEQHAVIRPLIEPLLSQDGGHWDEADILQHASNFIDNFVVHSCPLKIADDAGVWVCIYLHKVSTTLGPQSLFMGEVIHEIHKRIYRFTLHITTER